MLKRENDDIFHTFKWRSAVWTGEALGEDNPDSTMCVSSVPIALLQDLTVEGRKAETVLIAISIDVGAELYPEISVCETRMKEIRPNIPMTYGHEVR